MLTGTETPQTPPAAGTPAQEVKERWEVERKRQLAARFKFKRECEERGEDCVLATPDPPVDPPAYWRTNAGEPTVTPLASPPVAAVDPSKIELKWGVLGRPRQHKAGEGLPSPEDQFREASLKDRAMAVLGVSW